MAIPRTERDKPMTAHIYRGTTVHYKELREDIRVARDLLGRR